jgi:hypothetical protein
MPKDLQKITAPTTKHTEIASMRVARETLLHLQGQAVHPFAHVPCARPRARHERPAEAQSSPRQDLHHSLQRVGVDVPIHADAPTVREHNLHSPGRHATLALPVSGITDLW